MSSKKKVRRKIGVVVGLVILVMGGGIANFNKNVQAIRTELQEKITYLNEFENKYILQELQQEYLETKVLVTEGLESKNKKELIGAIEKIEQLEEKIIKVNNKIYEEKLTALKRQDIKGFKQEWIVKIEEEIKDIENNKEDEKFKLSLNKIDSCMEYIKNNKAKLEKEKQDILEEEKRKEEEKKKEEEKQAELNKEEITDKEEPKKEEEPNKEEVDSNKPEKDESQSFVSNLKIANQTNKIITVTGTGGSSAEVKLHKKVNGLWKEVISSRGFVGYNGIGDNKKEGDGKTPTGVYSFGFAFGVANNPGSNLSYRKVTENDYWVDDTNSKYYNQWVNTTNVEKDWNSAEHLIKTPSQYKYAATLNYNTSNIPGNGSAIFLHCATGRTAGCIGVPENIMVKLLKEIDGNTRIVIAKNRNDINKY